MQAMLDPACKWLTLSLYVSTLRGKREGKLLRCRRIPFPILNLQNLSVCALKPFCLFPRWMHAVCDNLFTEEEVEQAADEGFDCTSCQPYVVKPVGEYQTGVRPANQIHFRKKHQQLPSPQCSGKAHCRSLPWCSFLAVLSARVSDSDLFMFPTGAG